MQGGCGSEEEGGGLGKLMGMFEKEMWESGVQRTTCMRFEEESRETDRYGVWCSSGCRRSLWERRGHAGGGLPGSSRPDVCDLVLSSPVTRVSLVGQGTGRGREGGGGEDGTELMSWQCCDNPVDGTSCMNS